MIMDLTNQLVMDGFDKVNNILTKRDLERKLNVQKRQEDRNNLLAGNERIGYFDEAFTLKRCHIEKLLHNASIIDKSMLPTYFNDISKEILILQKYVASSNIFLRTYDIKKCHESIQELTAMAKELENELLPKKKFGFKNKPKSVVTVLDKDDKDEVDFKKPKTTIIDVGNFCGFLDKSDQSLEMHSNEIHMKDVSIENLRKCTVKLFGSPSTLHLNRLSNCMIFSGPVSTSIFAENCENCTLVIACQQLRLHSSKNVRIYLHVTSRAIMEDCNEILLTPYNWRYPGVDEDFKKVGFDLVARNNWQCVDDFNWLNAEKHSPNWGVLDPADLVHDWGG